MGGGPRPYDWALRRNWHKGYGIRRLPTIIYTVRGLFR